MSRDTNIKRNCEYCPWIQAQVELAQKMFFKITCEYCETTYYSPGSGHLIPLWDAESKRLLPRRAKLIALPEADFKAYMATRFSENKVRRLT